MLLARATAREGRWRSARRWARAAAASAAIADRKSAARVRRNGARLRLCYSGIKALVAAIPDNAIPARPDRVGSAGAGVQPGADHVHRAAFRTRSGAATARRDLVEPLKDSGRGVSGGFRRGTAQYSGGRRGGALAGAAGWRRSADAELRPLQQVDLGLNPQNILVARLPLPRGQYETAAAKQRFFSQLLPRLKGLPGVVDATKPVPCLRMAASRPIWTSLAIHTLTAGRPSINW